MPVDLFLDVSRRPHRIGDSRWSRAVSRVARSRAPTFRSTLFVGGVLVLVILSQGCAHRSDESDRIMRAASFAPQVPAFLAGPMVLLLTNTGSFSAHVSISGFTDGSADAFNGDLLGRGGILLFAPQPAKQEKKGPPSGDFSFLWDVGQHRGYLLSEALQAYAPISASVRPTNLVVSAEESSMQKIDGHPCMTQQATIQMTDGSVAGIQTMRATDLRGFPVRIVSLSNAQPAAISFSKIRFQAPPADLFTLPDGFTKYSSAEAMVDELALRHHNLKRPRPDWWNPEPAPLSVPPPTR